MSRLRFRLREHFVSSEGEHTPARSEWLRFASEAVHTDTEARIPFGQPLQVEPACLEPLAD
ncbi:MAG: hypothetical protein QOH50_1799 [Kribbellaceae bacterium]|jgi:hypothetical protein|nr:hypothetical protein [Kribbellaceae bacterium]